MPSLKGNVILNGINTVMGIIYPIITFPYAARVLLPEGIGSVNFLNSIVQYIVLFTSLGIPMYAVREVARYRDDIEIRNKITIEILILSFVLCLTGYAVVWAIANFVSKVETQASIFYVLSLTIVFNTIGVQWFYQGVEDFKFITIRGVVVRTLAAVSLFLFVKTSNDLLIYAIILVASTVGNNILNFIHLRKHIEMNRQVFWDLNLTRHIRPSLKLFVFNIITSIYINLNTIMLGLMHNDWDVGLYIAGNKISHIALTLISSLGIVMLPRCANLIKNNRLDEFKLISTKAIRLVFCASFPITLGLILLADPIIKVFCGIDFIDAVPVLIWTAPIVIVIAISNVLGIQILYPLGKENIVIYSTLYGALINLSLNILLIPRYSYIGAAASTLVAEIAVTIYQFIAGRRFVPITLKWNIVKNYVYSTILVFMTLWIIINFVHNDLSIILCGIILSTLFYSISLFVLKDEVFLDIAKYLHFIK